MTFESPINLEQEKEAGAPREGEVLPKDSQGGKEAPAKISPAVIEHSLKGIHYPSQKIDLIKKAKENEAPSQVLSFLGKFEDKEYKSPIDVAKEVGRIE